MKGVSLRVSSKIHWIIHRPQLKLRALAIEGTHDFQWKLMECEFHYFPVFLRRPFCFTGQGQLDRAGLGWASNYVGLHAYTQYLPIYDSG